jgi:hypothetical protein
MGHKFRFSTQSPKVALALGEHSSNRVIMEAYVGIDVAFAKKKFLPISVCVWRDGSLEPLPLRSKSAPIPPRGSGNAKILDDATVKDFAESTAKYLRDVENAFGVTIRRIAIDAPSDPKMDGCRRRDAEIGLDQKRISCITTPDAQQFHDIHAKALVHLANGGEESRLPHANQLWMLVGFELFRRLRQDWECLEVFPQAIAATLGANGIHKSKGDGLLRQLSAAAQFTRWPKSPCKSCLKHIGYGMHHDNLDAYLAAWVASLDIESREAIGTPPNDVIWVPRLASEPNSSIRPDTPATPESICGVKDTHGSSMNLAHALEDVRISFLQLEFAIRMLTYCEQGKIDLNEFDTRHIVLLDKGNLGFPSGHFSDPDNIIRAAGVSVSLAFGASALTLDKAFEAAGVEPDPLSEDNRIKLRTVIFMVRCAYAHGIAEPTWKVKGRYSRKISVELRSGRIELDLEALHGNVFDFDQLGGHHIWFQIRDEAVTELGPRCLNLK